MLVRHTRRRVDRPTACTLGLVCALLTVAALVGHPFWVGYGDPQSGLVLPWWFFAVAFAATEAVVMHIQVRREAQTVSVSELPLVLGLFFATPLALVVGRLAGSAAILVLHRKSSPLKICFNLALVCVETAVALAVFHAVTADLTGIGPRDWVAALAAVAVANAVGAVAIGSVIALYEGHLSVPALAREAVLGQVATPAVVILALLAVNSLVADPASGWLLAGSAVVALAGYRAYASLADRHLSLERLFDYSQAVTRSPQTDDILRNVLDGARRMLAAEHAELVLPTGADVVRVVLTSEGQPRRLPAGRVGVGATLWSEVLNEGAAVLLPRNTRDARSRAWLTAHEHRELLAVPLHDGDAVVGMLLVADRLGEVRTFARDDLLLAETLANQASVALQKGELIARLQHDALHDALTMLPNRTALQERLEVRLDEMHRGHAAGLAVMILDLDGFKDVNDTLGHHQGDVVLVEVARRLTDALGDDGMLARLGGDEFAVLSPVADTDTATDLAHRLVSSLTEPLTVDEMRMEVGTSVGIALAPHHGDEVSTLLKHADMAMYQAKSSGQCIVFYESRIDTASARRLSMAGDLRAALLAGDIEVHLQPQVDVRSGDVRAFEALARWTHPELGSVSPDEFIPLAERSGLIRQLTLAVLDRSLAAAAQWRDTELNVAVNVSARNLFDASLVEDVRDALTRHDVEPGRLVVEITESAVMADPDRAIALLEALRDMGVLLSVDDFGTGYSSLSYLKRLPIHEVKIDRSFVTGLVHGTEDCAIVRSIVDLGRNLRLEVVAEGVEDRPTLHLLGEIGCTRVQGWQIGHPMPVDAVHAWLRRRTTSRRGPLARTA